MIDYFYILIFITTKVINEVFSLPFSLSPFSPPPPHSSPPLLFFSLPFPSFPVTNSFVHIMNYLYDQNIWTNFNLFYRFQHNLLLFNFRIFLFEDNLYIYILFIAVNSLSIDYCPDFLCKRQWRYMSGNLLNKTSKEVNVFLIKIDRFSGCILCSLFSPPGLWMQWLEG